MGARPDQERGKERSHQVAQSVSHQERDRTYAGGLISSRRTPPCPPSVLSSVPSRTSAATWNPTHHNNRHLPHHRQQKERLKTPAD